jgi:hypothetical protein
MGASIYRITNLGSDGEQRADRRWQQIANRSLACFSPECQGVIQIGAQPNGLIHVVACNRGAPA